MKRCLIAVCVLVVTVATVLAQQDTGESNRRVLRGRSGGAGWLGMGIQCSRCSLRCEKRVACSWTFAELPGVLSVDDNGPADRAGIRTGDTLVSVNGKVLTSAEGGEAFGMVSPGQSVTLRYRRDGREMQARLVAAERPMEAASFALADSVRSLARLQTLQAQQERLRSEQSQRAFERQQEATRRVIEEMERTRAQLRDSVRSKQVQHLRQVLDNALQQYRAAESVYAHMPRPMPVPSLAPLEAAPTAPPAIAAAPTAAPAVPAAPLAAAVPAVPLAPMTYAEHREFGPLRYSGRLGSAVIEARSPYAVTTTEISDSEVVVTSRDLSVRIAVRPRLAPLARPAPAPKPVPTPRPAQPARPARPPED